MLPSETGEIVKLISRFLTGQERSLKIAGEIEGAIAQAFPGDERFEDVLDALASYQPGGGLFLYDENAMIKKLEWTLSVLESKSTTRTD